MMKVHHVGYLVKRMDQAVHEFEQLGFVEEHKLVYDSIRKINIVFMKSGDYRIELVCPDKESPIYGLMKRYKNSPYHICYECDDLQLQIQPLTETGCLVIQEPCIAPAINNRRVAFLMNSEIGMIELVEKE